MNRTHWLLIFLILLPFIALNYFNHPSADDFHYAADVFELGFWEAQQKIYRDWSGRYIATFLLTFNPLTWKKIGLYPWFSFLNQILLAFSIWYFTKQLFSYFKILASTKLVSLGLFIISVVHLRSLNEGFYWMAGYVNYTFAISGQLIIMGMMLKSSKTESKSQRNLYFVYLSLLSFLVIGLNETTMLQLDLILFLAFILSIFKKHWSRIYLLALNSIAAGSSLLVAAAPGNSVRKGYFPDAGPISAIPKTIISSLEHFGQFLSLPLLIGILFVSVCISRDEKLRESIARLNLKVRYISLAIFLTIASGLYPALASMGGNPRGRVDNMFYILFVFLMLILSAQLGVKYHGWFDKKFRNYKTNTLLTAFLISSLLWINPIRAYIDLFGTAHSFSKEMNERYAQAKAYKNQSEPLVLELKTKPWPKSFAFSDLTEDPKHWRNRSFARYFGIPDVILIDPSSDKK